jgi:hypothetical protein
MIRAFRIRRIADRARARRAGGPGGGPSELADGGMEARSPGNPRIAGPCRGWSERGDGPASVCAAAGLTTRSASRGNCRHASLEGLSHPGVVAGHRQALARALKVKRRASGWREDLPWRGDQTGSACEKGPRLANSRGPLKCAQISEAGCSKHPHHCRSGSCRGRCCAGRSVPQTRRNARYRWKSCP